MHTLTRAEIDRLEQEERERYEDRLRDQADRDYEQIVAEATWSHRNAR